MRAFSASVWFRRVLTARRRPPTKPVGRHRGPSSTPPTAAAAYRTVLARLRSKTEVRP